MTTIPADPSDPSMHHARLNMIYCRCGERWSEHLSGGVWPYPPSLLCRCGHSGRHHRQGDITRDRRSCMALGWHSGVSGYDGSNCYFFEPLGPGDNLVTFRRGAGGRFERVPS